MLLIIYVILAIKIIFTQRLLTPWLRIMFVKVTKNLIGKRSEFANFLVTFGRSQIAIYATYLAPICFRVNAKSNPHIRLVYTWRESSKTRVFIINGKIFLKWRIYPSARVNGLERHFENSLFSTQYVCWKVTEYIRLLGVNGLERHFENTCTQYVCWNVK